MVIGGPDQLGQAQLPSKQFGLPSSVLVATPRYLETLTHVHHTLTTLGAGDRIPLPLPLHTAPAGKADIVGAASVRFAVIVPPIAAHRGHQQLRSFGLPRGPTGWPLRKDFSRGQG